MRLLPAVAALALLAGACGGQRHAQADLLRRGRSVFAASCAGCHTLTGRDSQTRGGDLAIAKLTAPELASFIRVMPVHLSFADVNAVAAYVEAAAATRR